MTSYVNTRPLPDEQLDTVTPEVRRRLLGTLLDKHHGDTPIKIDEWVGETDTESTLITMHHVHLPKLVARGFIRWDRETNLVTRGPQFGEIEPLLTVLDDHQDELPNTWV